jgi:hypothetical protein
MMIALMMEAICTSETSVHFNVSTRCYIPEDSKLPISYSTVFSYGTYRTLVFMVTVSAMVAVNNGTRFCTSMASTVTLKLFGRLQCHDLHAEFYENLPIGTKVVSGGTQTDSMVIS